MKIKFTHLLATGILLTCSAPLSAGAPYLGVENSAVCSSENSVFGRQCKHHGRYLIGYQFPKQESWQMGMEVGLTYTPTFRSTIFQASYQNNGIDVGVITKYFFDPNWYGLGKLGMQATYAKSDLFQQSATYTSIHAKSALGVGYQFTNGLALHFLLNHKAEDNGYANFHPSLGILYHF